MNYMKQFFYILLIVTAIGCDHNNSEEKVTVNPLEGTWQCKFLSEGMSETPSSEIAAMSVCFSDDTIVYMQDETPVMKGTFKINETNSPKQLDILYEDGDEKIQIPAIFEINQLTLKLCHPQDEGGNRPTNFEKSKENCLAIFEKVEDTY